MIFKVAPGFRGYVKIQNNFINIQYFVLMSNFFKEGKLELIQCNFCKFIHTKQILTQPL
jgi:hypothetical protein